MLSVQAAIAPAKPELDSEPLKPVDGQTAPNEAAMFATTLATMLNPFATPATPVAKPAAPEGTSELEPAATETVDTDTASAAGSAAEATNALSAGMIPMVSVATTGTTGAAGGAAAGPAFAAASHARAAANGAPVDDVNNDPAALNPEFKARLDRVKARMQDEFGHDVEIVEGYRSQARQNHLYEQGRTRDGNVVTWTKSSKHTAGLAVDVKIDGSYDNPVAYQRLAQIAAQEGLRTLGARDPGHLELPTRAGAAAWGAAPATPPSENGMSRAVEMALARAGIQAPLPDGDEAQSSNDGQFNALLGGNLRSRSESATLGLLRDGYVAAARQGASSNQSGAGGQSSSRREPAAGVPDVASVAAVADVADVAQVATVAVPGVVSGMGGAASPAFHTPNTPAPVHVMSGTLAADKVGQLLDARENAPALPLSHMNLRLDNDAGGTDHIRINLRGNAVDARIALGDSAAANRMSLRVGELQRTLEHHGLDADGVHVTAARDTIGLLQSASASTDTGAGWNSRQGQPDGRPAPGQDTAAQRERQPNHRESNRQDADDTRQRARRASRGQQQ